ncbi:Endoglucanase [Purpureocillium lavendulum]|uniref:Endoglucanase n=1 Tax=Purpureocillium lavendulum TaxID=1247861 RepID=A0AB34G2V0_9HYPO|nr:Endoglucanase [Purpureocillium lavendulum]
MDMPLMNAPAAAPAASANASASASVSLAAAYNRSACTECQRRKQKCNREWPCDRCQRRKIADECRYNTTNPPPVPPASGDVRDKDRDKDDLLPRGNQGPVAPNPNGAAEGDPTAAGSHAHAPWFDTLTATRVFSTLGLEPPPESSKNTPKEDSAAADSSPQIQRVLKLLPKRQSMDKLISTFTQDVNYHYYIIYPPDFLRDYHIWWERCSKNRPLSLQYTCLLAMICACCIQHADNDMQSELEQFSRMPSDDLSEQLHNAVRELATVIPVGHYHIFNLQRLLHSCYWYKAEARFLEAWHVLSGAILEARELEFHKEPPPGTETDHDREMRRRLWCILDTWDWQISSGLSRPKIIDRADCDAELPSLTLEKFASQAPSPLLHMKMQSELTRRLASRFSAPKNVINPDEVREYQGLIEDWVRRFPPVYDFENPDTSKDAQYPWIFPHRYYVYTMACLLILNPIRHYMVKSYTWDSPPEELDIRAVGIDYSLKLMKTLRRWVDRIYNRDGRLHFIIFSIFDTAAILCTAIIKDHERTIPNRGAIVDAVTDAVAMLQQLNSISKTSKTSYDLLERLVRRLPEKSAVRNDTRKKARISRMPAPVQNMPENGLPVLQPGAAVTEPPSTPVSGAATGGPSAAPNYSQPLDVPRPAATVVSQSAIPSSHAPPEFYVVHSYPVNGQTTVDNNSQSTCSEDTPPSIEDQMLSSFSTVSDAAAMPLNAYAPPAVTSTHNMPSAPAPVSQADDGSSTFELETVTQAQLGGLAPLWNWHSENLGFTGVPAPAPPPAAPLLPQQLPPPPPPPLLSHSHQHLGFETVPPPMQYQYPPHQQLRPHPPR